MAGKYTKIYAGAAVGLMAGVLVTLYMVLAMFREMDEEKGNSLDPNPWPTYVTYGTIPHLLLAFVLAEEFWRTILAMSLVSAGWYGLLSMVFILNIGVVQHESSWNPIVKEADTGKALHTMMALVACSVGSVIVNLLLGYSVTKKTAGEAEPLLKKESNEGSRFTMFTACFVGFADFFTKMFMMVSAAVAVALTAGVGTALLFVVKDLSPYLPAARWPAYLTYGTIPHLFVACGFAGERAAGFADSLPRGLRHAVLALSLASMGWYSYLFYASMARGGALLADEDHALDQQDDEAFMDIYRQRWQYSALGLASLVLVIQNFLIGISATRSDEAGEEPMQEEAAEAVV